MISEASHQQQSPPPATTTAIEPFFAEPSLGTYGQLSDEALDFPSEENLTFLGQSLVAEQTSNRGQPSTSASGSRASVLVACVE